MKNLIFLLLFLPCYLSAQINASWDASISLDVEKYRLYWGTESRNYTDSRETYEIQIQLPGELFGDHTYYFTVIAIDFAGNESDYSEEVSFEIVTGIEEYTMDFKDCDEIKTYNVLSQRVEYDKSQLPSGFYVRCCIVGGNVISVKSEILIK